MELMKRLFREEEGQGMTEYVLIIALIALAAFAIMTTFGENIKGIFTDANDKLTEAVPE